MPMHKVAEVITVALIRWFEGKVHWSGSPEECWRQITPYLCVPTVVEGDLFSLLGEVFFHTDFLLRSASIRVDLGPNRTLTLSRPLRAVPLSSTSVAQVIASAETLLWPERAGNRDVKIGNPNGNEGAFYEAFQDKKSWDVIPISALDVPSPAPRPEELGISDEGGDAPMPLHDSS